MEAWIELYDNNGELENDDDDLFSWIWHSVNEQAIIKSNGYFNICDTECQESNQHYILAGISLPIKNWW